MLHTSLIVCVLWFPVFAVASLAVIFLWRRLWRELPFFFLYLGTALLSVLWQYVALRLGPRPYFYAFWVSNLVAAAVVFFPLYEVFLRRLFAKFHKTGLYRKLFPLAAVVLLLLTIVTALEANDKGVALKMASRAFDFMRTAVLVFFVTLMLFMGRTWRRYDLGITLGFGIQAAVALANSALQARMHYKPTFLDTAELIAYDISCVIWLITFWKPDTNTAPAPANVVDPEMLHQARAAETVLKTWLSPGKSEQKKAGE